MEALPDKQAGEGTAWDHYTPRETPLAVAATTACMKTDTTSTHAGQCSATIATCTIPGKDNNDALITQNTLLKQSTPLNSLS